MRTGVSKEFYFSMADLEVKDDRAASPPTAAPVNPAGYHQATFSFRVAQWLLRLILHSLFIIEVKGLENIPRQGGYIFAGNHLSWVDAFLMLIGAPATPRIYFIAAREEVEHPAWRKFFTRRIGGVIPVDRGSGSPSALRGIARQVAQVLAGGGVLGLFPEGDVSGIETGRILPLKKGIGYFAANSGAAIVPVAFRGTKELWFRKKIVMVVGKPIPGQRGGKEVIEKQIAATAEALLALMPPPPAQNPKSRQFLKKFLTELFTQEVKEHPIPE
jgi:1-acyl-sn-glycerol-3-phosphate acyltransferase